LPLRRLAPVEVVWRSGDPPMDYRPGVRARQQQDFLDAGEAMTLPGGPKFSARAKLELPSQKCCVIFKVGPLF